MKSKSVLSQLTFYLEDDDHKPFDFNVETILFERKISKIENSTLLKLI